MSAPVEAGGGVVVRDGRIAVVHRPKYDDWSFPKGKLDPGESFERAALREVEEETGLRCALREELPSTRYRDSKGRPKVVRYWRMEPLGGEFSPSAEVDELRWVTAAEARRLLTYERDRALAAAQEDAADLRRPRHRVSPKAIRYWTARALAGWLVVAAVEVVWLVSTEGHRGAHVAGLAITASVALAHLLVMPRWRYRVHRWEAAPTAVYTQSGWFDQERRIAPISRIQTVDSERGPLEQVFGLANVTVTTASAAGPLKIRGLDRDTAQRLVDELTAAAGTSRDDAT